MFLLNVLLDSIRDHKVISDIFGFNSVAEKHTKTEALGMVMRLLLRSAALLSVNLHKCLIFKSVSKLVDWVSINFARTRSVIYF